MGNARKPVEFTVTERDDGLLEYVVERAGIFTLGWDATTYPDLPDGSRMRVVYGRWDGTYNGYCTGRGITDPVIVNRVQLRGGAVFDPDEAVEHYWGDQTAAWWLRVLRVGEWSAEAPYGTRDRVGFIVSVLAVDFLDHRDPDRLLHVHRRVHAPDRARLHQIEADRLADQVAVLNRQLETARAAQHVQERLAG